MAEKETELQEGDLVTIQARVHYRPTGGQDPRSIWLRLLDDTGQLGTCVEVRSKACTLVYPANPPTNK